MTMGLPGHSTTSTGSIQPPLSLPQASPQSSPQSPSKSKLTHGMSGPQERRGQKKNKKGKGRTKDADLRTSSGDDLTHQSSDSESANSTGDLLHWSRHCQYGPDTNGHTGSRGSRGRGIVQGKRGVSSSESDVSDSEASRLKAVWCKVRLQAHSSLALVFQVRACYHLTFIC